MKLMKSSKSNQLITTTISRKTGNQKSIRKISNFYHVFKNGDPIYSSRSEEVILEKYNSIEL
jgi:hypothetical protein